jgi:hypothetical protein
MLDDASLIEPVSMRVNGVYANHLGASIMTARTQAGARHWPKPMR